MLASPTRALTPDEGSEVCQSAWDQWLAVCALPHGWMQGSHECRPERASPDAKRRVSWNGASCGSGLMPPCASWFAPGPRRVTARRPYRLDALA